MPSDKNDINTKTVLKWEKRFAQNLSKDDHIQLFQKAIAVVEQRALKTLSIITLTVILDRVLHQGKEKHPLLAKVKISAGVQLKDIISDKDHDHEELIKALRYFLTDLLMVLGRITAGILTPLLHIALQEVILNDQENK